MAGAGYKLFNTGDVLTAAQVNTYLQEQTVMVFASSTARTTALSGVLAEGMVSYLQDTNAVEVYNGSAWVGVSGAGDVTEVQAGTGISVASGTGPIPVVTNTMATAIDAKGDLVVGTGADTFARLAVGGTNGHSLQVDSSTATGLKWAAPAGGSLQVATFKDVKAQGTQGGSFVSGAWRTRDLNTTVGNTITSASLSSNQISLPAGTYTVIASAEQSDVDNNQLRVYNVTDAATLVLGVNSPQLCLSIVQGSFTIAGTKTIELQHRCSVTRNTYGFGYICNWGDEVYAQITLIKES